MKMLDLSKRQVKRLRKRVREHGTEGVIHKGRGKRSNRKTPDDLREKTEKLLKEKYPDFGPKFASEKLRDDHGIEHSKETVRVMMVGLGLRKVRHQKEMESIGHGDLGKNITGRWSSSMGHTTNGSRKGAESIVSLPRLMTPREESPKRSLQKMRG